MLNKFVQGKSEQLQAIKQKHPVKLSRSVILLQGNVQPRAANVVKENIQQKK